MGRLPCAVPTERKNGIYCGAMSKQVPVLVTGGAGFVGRHLVKTLLERGARIIWIIDDLSTGSPPREWLSDAWKRKTEKTLDIYRKNGREITFVKEDALTFFYAQ